ncbi:MAG: hypothetical protein IT161_10785 [Bryobacterales bacterium]|nr:hypothetical protein [Bryobacterales bacterium]
MMAPAPDSGAGGLRIAVGRRVLASLLLLSAFWAVLLFLQFRDQAFEGGSGLYGDEGPHFLNALLIKDYLVRGIPESPVRFAERFFVAYPKVAPFAWPPLFDLSLVAWLLVVPDRVSWALGLVSLLTAGAAVILFRIVRQVFGAPSAWLVSLVFCSLHITQRLNSVVMLEGMLALFSLAFAWRLAAYMETPTQKNALWLGLLGAACCLTKGNGLAALLSAPVAFAFAGKWRLSFRPATLKAAALALALSAVPLFLAFRVIRGNQALNESVLRWLAIGTPAYGAALLRFLTPVLAAFAGIGILRTLFGLITRPPLPPLPAAMLAAGVAVFGFHVLFPHPADSRYMFAAVPFCLFFIPAGAPGRQRWGGRATVAWVVLALALYVPFGLSFRKAVPSGFRQALATIRQRPGGEAIRAIVASDDTGESAFIVAAAETNPKRNDIVVRGTKLVAESDWFRRRIHPLLRTPEQFVNRAESLGLTYLILDRSRVNKYKELAVIEQAVQAHPERFERIAGLPAGPDRFRNIEVYRFTQTSNPPRELVKYRLPYTLGREVSEAAHQ